MKVLYVIGAIVLLGIIISVFRAMVLGEIYLNAFYKISLLGLVATVLFKALQVLLSSVLILEGAMGATLVSIFGIATVVCLIITALAFLIGLAKSLFFDS